jgi:branched-chain amino acid transport system ATP-binding protein
MLRVENLSAWYGEAQALRSINVQVPEGQIVTLLGRNGSGKTTLLRSIIGLHRPIQGRIWHDETDISHWPPEERACAGLGYVPDDRGIYAKLTVEENLLLPPKVGPNPWTLQRLYQVFPVLRERRRYSGGKLSGGEQQMLSIARVLRMGARVLLLDEPTEGLSPLLVQELGALLEEAKREGLAILLVEQNLRFATAVAERHYLLVHGEIIESMDNDQLKARERELLQHLGV